MVFLFQLKAMQGEAAPFRPAEMHSLNLGKALEGSDGVTAVPHKTARYIEYALQRMGHPIPIP